MSLLLLPPVPPPQGVATLVSYRTHEGSGMWELRVFLGHRKEVTEQVLEAVDPWQYRL